MRQFYKERSTEHTHWGTTCLLPPQETRDDLSIKLTTAKNLEVGRFSYEGGFSLGKNQVFQCLLENFAF